jgi:hypothetical protein
MQRGRCACGRRPPSSLCEKARGRAASRQKPSYAQLVTAQAAFLGPLADRLAGDRRQASAFQNARTHAPVRKA